MTLSPLTRTVRLGHHPLMPYTVCPECDEEFLVRGHPALGERIECPECHAQLRVVSWNPLELDLDKVDWCDDPDDEYDEEE